MSRAICTGLMFSIICLLMVTHGSVPGKALLHVALWPFLMGVILEIALKLNSKKEATA